MLTQIRRSYDSIVLVVGLMGILPSIVLNNLHSTERNGLVGNRLATGISLAKGIESVGERISIRLARLIHNVSFIIIMLVFRNAVKSAFKLL